MSGKKEEPDDLLKITTKMSQLCITKGAIPKQINKIINRKEGKKRYTEKASSSNNFMTSDNSFMNRASNIAAHKSEKYSATGIKKAKTDIQSKVLNYYIQSKHQFKPNKTYETEGYLQNQNYVSTSDGGNNLSNNNQNIMNDEISVAQMASQGVSTLRKEDYIDSGNEMLSKESNVENYDFGISKNISSKEGTTKQNITGMMERGNKIFDRNIRRIEKDGNEVKSTKIKKNRKKGKKKMKGKKLKDNYIKSEKESPETDMAQFQHLSYADTVRYGVKRDTNASYTCLNDYLNVENSPVNLAGQPSTSTTKVGNHLQHNRDQLQEVPNMCPALQTKSSTTLIAQSSASNTKIKSNLQHNTDQLEEVPNMHPALQTKSSTTCIAQTSNSSTKVESNSQHNRDQLQEVPNMLLGHQTKCSTTVIAQPSTSTTKVGSILKQNREQLQEVPNMHPVHQTKCSTKNKPNINLCSESTARKVLFPNMRESSTRHMPFLKNNQYHQNNTDMNSQIEDRQSFADFCKHFCNVFTVMTQDRNLLMVNGSVSLQDDAIDLEKETATITEIFDPHEGDENSENPVAEESQNIAQMKVHEPQIILEAENYAEDESNKILFVNSISGLNVDLPVNLPRYQDKYEQIFIKPNTLLNKMTCVPGTWSIVTDSKTNGNMLVMNAKPSECTMTIINCNYATLSIIRLPIIPPFDARNMILITSSVGNDETIIPKTIFTVSSPPVDYNAIGAWYLIFNNPYVLNGTCAGEWFWSPYLQLGVREIVFYWIPYCTSQFMYEGIDAVWIWFPTHPAAKETAKYIIPHVMMKNNPEQHSDNPNSTIDVSYIAVNPTTRSNLISVPVLTPVQNCDNINQQTSNHNEHMDQTKGFFPLSLKLPTNIPKNNAHT